MGVKRTEWWECRVCREPGMVPVPLPEQLRPGRCGFCGGTLKPGGKAPEEKTVDDSGYVELDGCVVQAVTEKAVLVAYEDDEFWVPKSVIGSPDPDSLSRGDVETIEIAEWFARKEGIT